MRSAPCKDCPKRYPGCHAKCHDYITWKKDWDEHQAKLRMEREQRRINYK